MSGPDKYDINRKQKSHKYEPHNLYSSHNVIQDDSV